MEDGGKSCIVLYPDHPSVQEQIHLIQNLIDEKVEAIAVAANDEYALTPVLTQAREKGISVITLDADVEAGSRSIYISPVDARELGKEPVSYTHLWPPLKPWTMRAIRSGPWEMTKVCRMPATPQPAVPLKLISDSVWWMRLREQRRQMCIRDRYNTFL